AERADEGTRPFAGDDLDEVERLRALLRNLHTDRQCLAERRPQGPVPRVELPVEVLAAIPLAARVDALRSELGELGVDELRDRLERRRPVAMPAAEHGVAHACERRG